MQNRAIFIGSQTSENIYAVNRLFKEELISCVVFVENITQKKSFTYGQKLYRFLRFFGINNIAFHKKRILLSNYNHICDDLECYQVYDLSSQDFFDIINNLDPSFLILNGLSQVTLSSLSKLKYNIININPGDTYYNINLRNLASIFEKKWDRVGFTIDVISSNTNEVSVICRENIVIDKSDNFYSIELKILKKAIDYISNGLTLYPYDPKVKVNSDIEENFLKQVSIKSYMYFYFLLVACLNLYIFKLKLNLLPKIKYNLKYLLGSFLYPFIHKSPKIFLYHEVTDNPSEFANDYSLSVSSKNFENQLIWLLRNYSIIDPIEILSKNNNSSKFDKTPAIITFDDGSLSAFNVAAPILRKYGLKALIFINMAPVEGHLFWAGLVHYLCNNDYFFQLKMEEKYGKKNKNYLYVTEYDIEKYSGSVNLKLFDKNVRSYYGKFAEKIDLIKNKDVFIYGSHFYNHYNATTLSDSELKEQIFLNSEALKTLNGNPDLFAYPFGQPGSCFNSRTNSLIFSSGVSKIFYSNPGINNSIYNNCLYRITPGNDFSCGYMKFITIFPHLYGFYKQNKNH